MTDSRDIDWAGDVMITDPPYAQRVYTHASSHSPVKGRRHRDLKHDAIDNSLMVWTCGLAARMPRWSCIFTDLESVGAWAGCLQSAGATYVRALPWIRWSMPQLSGDRPPQGAEMIVLAWGSRKGRKSWNGPGNLTNFDEKALRGTGKHPCEKPLDLILRLTEYFSDVGESIIDPFAGSGTTAVAAKLLGRKCQFNELDEHWMTQAKDRLAGGLTVRDQERLMRYRSIDTRDGKTDASRVEKDWP